MTFDTRTGALIICYHCRAQAYQHIDCAYTVEYGLCNVCVAALRRQGALRATCERIYHLNHPDAPRRLPEDAPVSDIHLQTNVDAIIMDTRQARRLCRAHYCHGLTIGLLIGGIACHIVVIGALLFK